MARQVTVARGVTFGLHRASFMQLAARLAAVEMARLGVAPATARGVEAVAARVSFEAVREGALAYFAPVARFPGFARALAATLGELAKLFPRAPQTRSGANPRAPGPPRRPCMQKAVKCGLSLTRMTLRWVRLPAVDRSKPFWRLPQHLASEAIDRVLRVHDSTH